MVLLEVGVLILQCNVLAPKLLRASPRVPKNLIPKPWSFPTRQNLLERINKTISNSFQ
jgi:hypothetical protein